MEQIFQLAEDQRISSQRLGILVTKGRGDGIHIGLLYRAKLYWEVLDFVGVGRLGGGAAFPRHAGCHVLPVRMDAYRAQFVAAMASRIWRRRERLPYGLRYVDTTFDLRGRLVLGQGASGLTCGTFVLAVFRAAGVLLLDQAEWPTRIEDVDWQSQVVARFEVAKDGGYPITGHQIRQLDREIGCARYRPEEVAVAAQGPEYPMGFREASKQGKWLKECFIDLFEAEEEDEDFETGFAQMHH